MNNYLVLDLETGSQEKYGRKGNWLYNPLVAVGMCTKDEVHSKYVYPDKLENLVLDGVDVIIGHNITYDLLYLWHLEDLQHYFTRGGKIWDTLHAEYILTGQKHKFASLRDIAVNKYGCKERAKLMEDYWNQGIDTIDIPKELVLQDVEQDVLDTKQIYLEQVSKAKEYGMTALIEELQDSILATTEMVYNGTYVELETLEKNAIDLEFELERQKQKLHKLVGNYWINNDTI